MISLYRLVETFLCKLDKLIFKKVLAEKVQITTCLLQLRW